MRCTTPSKGNFKQSSICLCSNSSRWTCWNFFNAHIDALEKPDHVFRFACFFHVKLQPVTHSCVRQRVGENVQPTWPMTRQKYPTGKDTSGTKNRGHFIEIIRWLTLHYYLLGVCCLYIGQWIFLRWRKDGALIDCYPLRTCFSMKVKSTSKGKI